LDGGIVYWRSVEASGILWRVVVRRKLFYYRQSRLFQKSSGEIFSNWSKFFIGALSLTILRFGQSDMKLEL